MSTEDLEKYETEMELQLYREYRDIVRQFTYVVETERRFYLCNGIEQTVHDDGGRSCRNSRFCAHPAGLPAVLPRKTRICLMPAPSQSGTTPGATGVSSAASAVAAARDRSTKISPSRIHTGWCASCSRAGSIRADRSGSTRRPSAENSQP